MHLVTIGCQWEKNIKKNLLPHFHGYVWDHVRLKTAYEPPPSKNSKNKNKNSFTWIPHDWFIQALGARTVIAEADLLISIGNIACWFVMSKFGCDLSVDLEPIKTASYQTFELPLALLSREAGATATSKKIFVVMLPDQTLQHTTTLKNIHRFFSEYPPSILFNCPKTIIKPFPFLFPTKEYRQTSTTKWSLFGIEHYANQMMLLWRDSLGNSTRTAVDKKSFALAFQTVDIFQVFSVSSIPNDVLSTTNYRGQFFAYKEHTNTQQEKEFADQKQVTSHNYRILANWAQQLQGSPYTQVFHVNGTTEEQQVLSREGVFCGKEYSIDEQGRVHPLSTPVNFRTYTFHYTVLLVRASIHPDYNSVLIREIIVWHQGKTHTFANVRDWFDFWMRLNPLYIVTIDCGCRALYWLQVAMQQEFSFRENYYQLVGADQMLIDLSYLETTNLFKKKWRQHGINWHQLYDQFNAANTAQEPQAMLDKVHQHGDVHTIILLAHELSALVGMIPPTRVLHATEQEKFGSLWFNSDSTKNYAFPYFTKKKETFEGGYNLPPPSKPIIYHDVVDLDISSAYPSEIINRRLCPTIGLVSSSGEFVLDPNRIEDTENVLPRFLEDLRQRRSEARDVLKDEIKQQAIKLCSNAAYGVISMYFPEWAQKVTWSCRETIKVLMQAVSSRDYEVLSVDTDGLLMHSSSNETRMDTSNGDAAIPKSSSHILSELSDVIPADVKVSIGKIYREIILFSSKKWAWYDRENRRLDGGR